MSDASEARASAPYGLTCLIFSYDVRKNAFQYLSYTFAPTPGAPPVAGWFAQRLEPTVRDAFPGGAARSEEACAVGSREILRSFRYVEAGRMGSIRKDDAVVARRLEIRIRENLDEPERSAIELIDDRADFARCAALYRAIAGMKDVSMAQVRPQAERMELILAHAGTDAEGLAEIVRVAAALQQSGTKP